MGASFAGLELLYQLERQGYWRKNPQSRVWVVDQFVRSAYIPLIHEELFDEPERCAPVAFRRFVEALPGVEFVQGRVTKVDFPQREVTLHDGTRLRGAQLVLALGSSLAAPHELDPEGRCLTLKWAQDQSKLRERIAAEAADPLRVTVIGGGLSGVELAAELAHRTSENVKVSLVHGQATLLASLNRSAGRRAEAALRKLGVDLYLEHRLTRVEPTQVRLRRLDGQSLSLDADIVCWAGGIRGPQGMEWVGACEQAGGWLAVDPYLRVWGTEEPYANCFAIGDLASIQDAPHGARAPTMRRAIEAIWQGKSLARTLTGEPHVHPMKFHWPHGVSVGPTSLVCYRGWALDLGFVGRWFRRWLAKMYLRRYRIS